MNAPWVWARHGPAIDRVFRNSHDQQRVLDEIEHAEPALAAKIREVTGPPRLDAHRGRCHAKPSQGHPRSRTPGDGRTGQVLRGRRHLLHGLQRTRRGHALEEARRHTADGCPNRAHPMSGVPVHPEEPARGRPGDPPDRAPGPGLRSGL